MGTRKHKALFTKVPPVDAFQPQGLLRASSAGTVLHGFGKLLSDSSGDDSTYDLSTPVDGTIDCFLSHNWSLNRILKFLVWALHFNFDKAFLIAMVVSLSGAVCTWIGWIPIAVTSWGPTGVTCWASTVPTFLLALVGAHEIDHILDRRKPSVFFDKTCIHQTDPYLKKHGIMKLGAFIAASSDMLVCYSEDYLTKLWTLYEIACYLLVHPWKPVSLIHAYFPPVLIMNLLGPFVVIGAVRYIRCSPSVADAILDAAMSHASMVISLMVVKQQVGAHKSVEEFQTRKAICLQETDRSLVEKNIVEVMKLQGLVDLDAEHDEALAIFDEVVKDVLPGYLVHSMGHAGVKWWTMVRVFILARWPNVLDIMAARLRNQWSLEDISDPCNEAVRIVIIFPLTISLQCLVARRLLRLQSWLRYPAKILSVLATFVFVRGTNVASQAMGHAATHSASGALLFVVFYACAAAAQAALFRRVCNISPYRPMGSVVAQ